MAESQLHQKLRVAAARFLLAEGCSAAGLEVTSPIGRFRIDAAGYVDKATPSRLKLLASLPNKMMFIPGTQPRTVLIECKASRADLMRDAAATEPLLRDLKVLHERRSHVREEFISILEPHLRQDGNFLFGDMEQWDFGASESQSSRLIDKAIERLERRVYGNTKFGTIARYCLADWSYVMTPKGLISPAEAPPGWGILELEDGLGGADVIKVAMPAPVPRAPVHVRHATRLVRNIAVANSRVWRGTRRTNRDGSSEVNTPIESELGAESDVNCQGDNPPGRHDATMSNNLA